MPLPLPRHFLHKPKQDDKSAHRARFNQEQSVQAPSSESAPLIWCPVFYWTCLTFNNTMKVGTSISSGRGI